MSYYVEYTLLDGSHGLNTETFRSSNHANHYIQKARKRYPRIKAWRIVGPHEAEMRQKKEREEAPIGTAD